MTDNEMRVAIAEACPTVFTVKFPESEFPVIMWRDRDKGALADPVNDLNAMHVSLMSRPLDWRMAFQNALQKRAADTGRIIVEMDARDHAECFLQTEREWRKINA